MSDQRYGVAVVGCGVVGARRAAAAAAHPWSALRVAVDPDEARARALAERHGAEALTAWSDALRRDDVEIVVVATPPRFLAEVAIAALKADKHVLVETPMARTVNEAVQIAGVGTRAQRVLKVGFNHRHHPGLTRAHALVKAGAIGAPIQLFARYGHEGRADYGQGWRGNRELAGGGQLMDLGVHLLDLVQWFAGEPQEVFAYTQSAVWPLGPLEDGASALLRWQDGLTAQLHTSWTQWRRHFSFELVGKQGCIAVEGLGGGFGTPTLTVARRRLDGTLSTERTTFEDEDASWDEEWAELMRAVDDHPDGPPGAGPPGTALAAAPGARRALDGAPVSGNASDGVTVISLVDALYRSAKAGQVANP